MSTFLSVSVGSNFSKIDRIILRSCRYGLFGFSSPFLLNSSLSLFKGCVVACSVVQLMIEASSLTVSLRVRLGTSESGPDSSMAICARIKRTTVPRRPR